MPTSSPWVIEPPKKVLAVGVADMIASNDPSSDLVTYSLGSCLGVTLYDPVKRVGGLLHLMLPTSSIDPERAAARPYMFVDTGVPRLFHALYSFGAEKYRLVVKVAGGAQILDDKKLFNIGERNLEALLAILNRNGITLGAIDVGGTNSRTVTLNLSKGHVSVSSPGQALYHL